ncbi:excitatory amino acid transporter 3-like [Babylonia areolata]|uniref:excitatory amino acid transporter 3-like n=1 Tax=Babylonia areolata TaxID=304850 RepID=UPI003FD686A9
MKRSGRNGEERSEGALQRFLAWDWCLLTCCIIGVGIGFAVGFALYFHNQSSDVLLWVGLPGELYMRMLKAAVLPLIISSIITGTASLKPKENGRVSVVSLVYIIVTNVIGGVVGSVLAAIIQPGVTESSVSAVSATLDTGNLQTADLFADLIRNLVPDNLVSACFEKSQTHYRKVSVPGPVPPVGLGGVGNSDNNTLTNITLTNITATNITATNILTTVTTESYQRYLGTAGGTNILGLVVACSVIGMASAQTGETARPFIAFFTAASDILILLVQWLVMFTPLGAASLIAKAVGQSSSIEETFHGLGLFVLAEVLGNVVLILGVLPLAHFLFFRRNPFAWMLGASRAAITSMVACSSAVAMPQHLKDVEARQGVDRRVTSFVVPLVTAINRDGSTMFIALTAVYMAQVQGAATAHTVLLITILASVGSLAVPAVVSSSVVTVLMVVDSLGMHPANIGILLALEWFSDRFRTLANNYSHVLCCIITWRLCKSALSASGPSSNGTVVVPSPKTTDLHSALRASSSDEEGASSSCPLIADNGDSFVAVSSSVPGERIALQSLVEDHARV